MSDNLLKRCAKESMLEGVVIGITILLFGGGLAYVLDYFGFVDLYKPFTLSTYLKEVGWTLMMFMFGFAFGVLSVMEKVRDSSRSETE